MLGETRLPNDDPEIERTYTLFLEVMTAGRKAVADKSEADWLRCGAKKDPMSGDDLPESRRVERDPHYTVRAWMAVVTYLLSDDRFLYE